MLRGAKWERERVLGTLDSLLRTRGVTPEEPQLVRMAVEATKRGGQGGFTDHLIAQVGFANGCREAITFDAGFGKPEGARLPEL